MSDESNDFPARLKDSAWPLYGAAFAAGLSLSVAWTAMPFVLSAMGGTKAHVGDAPAVNILAYMGALLVTGSWLGHLDVKWATRAAALTAMLSAALMTLTVLGSGLYPAVDSRVWVWLTIAAGGLGGAAMALFWPFLMSWVSASYEGLDLNRRLGRYNGSWSGGAVIGPLIGAWLVERGTLWPMLAAVLCFLTSFLLLGLAHNGKGPLRIPVPARGAPAPACDARVLADFRWMSRIALFCGWACFAIARSQFALQFTSLGYSKSQFGVYLTTVASCNFLALIASGRWAFWHFRAGLLIGAQGMMLAALFMIIYGRALGVLQLSAVVFGVAFGFAYSSHLYYGASASNKRSVRMVIHEIVISLGVTAGSWPGGHLAQHVGPYAPYWFAAGLVGAGILAQTAIHIAAQMKVAVSRTTTAADDVRVVEP